MDNETIQDLLKQIEELKKKVEVLETWKTAKEASQLSYPLDFISQKIILDSLLGTTAQGTFTTFTIRNGLVLAAS